MTVERPDLLPVMAPALTRRRAQRCAWPGTEDFYLRYHDAEWGVPLHDDRALYEFLVLEGAQAGLSWALILKKREAYRRAFEGFDPTRVARYGPRQLARLLADAGIVRNRMKLEAAVANARAFLEVQRVHGSFDAFIWRFIDGRPIQNRWRTLGEIPPRTELSDRISAELKKLGFKFVGSTIVYSHMQATGMVNDHLVGCFRHREVASLAESRAKAR